MNKNKPHNANLNINKKNKLLSIRGYKKYKKEMHWKVNSNRECFDTQKDKMYTVIDRFTNQVTGKLLK